jgi:hypothetical protein
MSETDALVEERGRAYGHPRPNHERIAALWSVILGVPVTAEQAALCMIQVKVSRLMQSPDHADSIDDIAGYAECYRQIVDAAP